jgi:cobalt-zinc-cadmium efflux system protein
MVPAKAPAKVHSYLRRMSHHHAHGHPHGHAHGHANGASAKALGTAFLLNLAFTLVELVGGMWTNSVAVLTDAMHDAGDCLVLGAAWYLQRVAMKGRDAYYSYGYGRYSMLGGWVTALVLIVGALFMLTISVPRLWQPGSPHAPGMMGLAVFGLLMNGLAAWKLHGGRTLNERGAYLHLLEDVLGWAAVLVGAIIIHFTGWVVVDPLLSIAISLYILVNAIGTLKRGTGILMQQIPPGVDLANISERLLAIPHVEGVHDQHTWTMDGSFIVHTVHLVVGCVDLEEARSIKQRARSELRSLGVHHATIELEWRGEECGLEHH